ncbi:acyltransferase [Brevibacillus ruminantium]|uniref:Acyltransferase n=1 Tax=Brevibacillus ruminantium TaxID=2950604 RepID=A0ABY4WD57_9BACL|nr:acyltransferase [Brevibacillus ruminantium]USG64998.1 acyltransferase [Brevibacillus ruminantium]
MLTDKKILKALFLIQLLSSFLVVAGHFTASVLYFNDPFWVTALNQISRYGTVLLAIVSGYMTALTLEQKKPSFWQFFSGKLVYIYIPFLLCGVWYHYLLNDVWPQTATEYQDIFLGKTGGHLYFIFMICQYYLFAYLFRNIITRKNILWLIWVFLAIQYVYINYLHQGWLGLTTRHLLPTWIFTFYVGHLVYWYRDVIFAYLQKKQTYLILFTGASVISAVYFVLSSTIYVAVHLSFVLATLITFLVMVVFFLEWVDKIQIRFRKGFTYFIYLIHSAFLILYRDWLNQYFGDVSWVFNNTWYSLIYLLIVYASTGLVALLLVWITKSLEALVKTRWRVFKERYHAKA